MSSTRKQRASDHKERLREAEGAGAEIREQGRKVERQLSLVGKLTNGWKRVHETNHFARLFRDEGQLG